MSINITDMILRRFLLLLIPFAAALACVPAADLDVAVSREIEFTGRGNCGEPLLHVSVTPTGPCRIKSFDVTLTGDVEDIDALSVICHGEILGKVKTGPGKTAYRLRCGRKLYGNDEFTVCADVRMSSAEGDRIGAELSAVNARGTSVVPAMPAPGSREVLLCRKLVYKPGDFGSTHWRIPAIRQLSDGTLLIVNDQRNDSELDLPQRIDVVSRYSTDGGFTWSEPCYIARNGGTMHGYGDPSLVETEDGTVICMFAGGERFMRSCKDNPQHSYYSVSKDFGRSWSEPVEITDLMWGDNPDNPVCKRYHSSFFTSGNDLLVTSGPYKGRVMVANVTACGPESTLYNHAVYSDDCGKTWHVSDVAFGGGADEAKLIQLNDGRILMAIRQRGPKAYVISEDGGQTWGEPGYWDALDVSNCNGDIIRYDENTILLSVPPVKERHDISVFVSHDETRSWSDGKVICHGDSMYSSMTVLPDGTVGIYFEKGMDGRELWYENVSLGWIESGAADCAVPEGVRLWEGGPLWAEFNLGASTPAEVGGYFSWGEVRPKTYFGWNRYKLCGGGSTSLKKYCTRPAYGKVDGLSCLEPGDDAAATMLGDGWRVPSKSDWEELVVRCEWTWTTVDGVNGYKVKGEDGAGIFLPATGYYSGEYLKECGWFGYYWTADIDPEYPYFAWDFYFQQVHQGCHRGGRDNGRCIRPIKD